MKPLLLLKHVDCATRFVGNLGPALFLRMEAVELKSLCMLSQICSQYGVCVRRVVRQRVESLCQSCYITGRAVCQYLCTTNVILASAVSRCVSVSRNIFV
jgi:hypothetical protein